MKPFKLLAILGFFLLCDQSFAQEAAPSPRMLVELSDLSSVAISPDDQVVAFRKERASVERNTYDTSWYIADLSGRLAPMRIADGGIPLRDIGGMVINAPPVWSADSRWIYYRAFLDGEVQVWRASRDGDAVERVTNDPADVIGFGLSNDGMRLIYTIGASREEIAQAEEKEYDEGIRVDGNRPIGQGLFRSAFHNGRLTTQIYSGDDMARQGLLDDRERTLRSIDLHSLANRPTIGIDRETADQLMTVKPDEPFSGDRVSQGSRIAAIEGSLLASRIHVTFAGQEREQISCADPACQTDPIEGVAWRPGTDQVVFTTRHRDRGYGQSLHIWDIEAGTVRTIAESNGLISGDRVGIGSTCAVGKRFAACVTASAGVPPQLEIIGLDSAERRVLYSPNQAINADAVQIEFLRWSDASGREFTGNLFWPTVEQQHDRAPLFITHYACVGYLRGGLGDEWPLAALAQSGIAALCMNRTPGNYAAPDRRIDAEAAQAGIVAAIDLLTARGMVDPERVGMGGFSLGSEITMWMAAHTNRLAAVSVASTSISPTYYWFHAIQPGFTSRLQRFWHVGEPDQSSERWRQFSPAYHSEKVVIPLLMQMPEQEYLQTVEYFSRIALQGTPTEMYVFPHEPHLKYQPRHKLAVYQRNLDWFRYWLQGAVDPDPAKADQYSRWEALRQMAP